MSVFNSTDGSITCKLVYYGPGLSGKTTTLKAVHSRLDPTHSVRPVQLRTNEETTLFFDFLPIDLGSLCGHRIRLQGYTTPGEVRYDLTRRCVLMGADGVVFVADATRRRLKENHESLASLQEHLRANGVKPGQVPVVLQYNKCDHEDAIPFKELDSCLNPQSAPAFCTRLKNPESFFDPFVEVVRQTLNGVAARHNIAASEPLGDVAARWLARLATTDS